MLFISFGSLFFSFFKNEFFIAFAGDDVISLIVEPNILGEPNRNLPNCSVLENCYFENFILADEPFAKALQNFKTFASVNNNLCRKLVSPLEFPINFDERFKVTSVLFWFQILTY